MFWDGWNSWLVELLGGALLSSLLLLLGLSVPLAFVVGLVVSVLYESDIDRNGWSWTDVGQRACGQAIPLVLSLFLR